MTRTGADGTSDPSEPPRGVGPPETRRRRGEEPFQAVDEGGSSKSASVRGDSSMAGWSPCATRGVLAERGAAQMTIAGWRQYTNGSFLRRFCW
jgi:hypothetical protein